jgi:hypothetical protein
MTTPLLQDYVGGGEEYLTFNGTRTNLGSAMDAKVRPSQYFILLKSSTATPKSCQCFRFIYVAVVGLKTSLKVHMHEIL